MRRALSLAVVLAAFAPLLSACSLGSKASPTATAHSGTATNVYSDTRFHFSFHYPSGWKAPAHGIVKTINGVQTYVVAITTSSQAVGLEVRVDAHLSDYSRIPDGKVVIDPQNQQQRFRYHKVQVSGWPSILIERFLVNKPVDELVTVTNTRKLSYTVEMVTPNPPLSSSAVKGYRLILDTLKIPFG